MLVAASVLRSVAGLGVQISFWGVDEVVLEMIHGSGNLERLLQGRIYSLNGQATWSGKLYIGTCML